MANDIEMRMDYLRTVLDEIVEQEAVTNDMTPDPDFVQGLTYAGEIRIATLDSSGYANYTGQYSDAKAQQKWESYKLKYNRNIKVSLDAIEVAQGGDLANATRMMSEIVRRKLIPEVDATRIAECCKIVGASEEFKDTHIAENQTLTKSNIVQKLRDGFDAIEQDYDVSEGLTCYVNMKLRAALRGSDEIQQVRNVDGGATSIQSNIYNLDGNIIKFVRPNRMISDITMKTYTSADDVDEGGWEKGPAGKDVNFLIFDPRAVNGVVAHKAPKFIPAAANQNADGDIIADHIFHDVIIPKNQVGGVFASLQSARGTTASYASRASVATVANTGAETPAVPTESNTTTTTTKKRILRSSS